MPESEINQILDLLKSSREATVYLIYSSNLNENEIFWKLLADAMLVIHDLLCKYNLNEDRITNRFLVSLHNKSYNQAITILDEIELYVEHIHKIKTFEPSLVKYGVLRAYRLLDYLYLADLVCAKASVQSFTKWFADNPGIIMSEGYSSLFSKLEEINIASDTSIREYNTLRETLLYFLLKWIDKVSIKLYSFCITDDLIDSLYPDNNVSIEYLANYQNFSRNNAQDISIAIVETDGKVDIADLIYTNESIKKRAYFCYPIDLFDYDRLYLSSRFQRLADNPNVSIVLGGSSYAMVGLIENLMPSNAVNLAVNAQDPYYTFLSVKTAKRFCKEICVAVITGGYYFWHIDMSDNPSDYHRSVITRVNFPVFSDFHNYKGEAVEPMKRAHTDPLLEKIFDFRLICDQRNRKLCTRLKHLSYYNEEINKRPVNGMLNFSFNSQTDTINDKAAKARTDAHNGNFNLDRLNANMNLLYEFLVNMNVEQVRVIVLFPPVTEYYRRHISTRLKDTTIYNLKKIQDMIYFSILDLTDSSDYDNSDFQDYDHLSDKGAEKLSTLIAACISKQEEWSI